MKGWWLIPFFALKMYGQETDVRVEWVSAYPFMDRSVYSFGNYLVEDFSNTVTDREGNIYVVTNNTYTTPAHKEFRLTKFSSTGIWLWSINQPDSVYKNTEAGAIAIDGSGDIHVAAYACDYYSYPAKADLIYLKYNPQGELLWNKRYGDTRPFSTAFIVPQSILFDFSDNAIIGGVVGQFNQIDTEYLMADSILIAKYSPEGELLWVAESNPDTVRIRYPATIQLDDSGNVHVACEYYWYTPGKGHYDYMLIKYNRNGEYQWHATWDLNDYSEKPLDLAVDLRGNSYITGYYAIPYNNSFNYAWLTVRFDKHGHMDKFMSRDTEYGSSIEFGGQVVTDRNDNVFISGQRYFQGKLIAALEKYDSSGTFLWEKTYDQYYFSGFEFFVNQNNSLIIAGLDDTLYYSIFNLDQDGVVNWNRKYPGFVGDSRIISVLANDQESNLLYTYVKRENVSRFHMVKLDNNGSRMWELSSADSGHYQLGKILMDANGNTYSYGQVDAGNDDLDCALIKYNSSGVALWGNRYQGPAKATDIPGDLAIDNSGNVYVTASSTGNGSGFDFASLKYNPNGEEQWRNRYNGPAFLADEPKKIGIDAAGNVYVAGNSLNADGNYDMVTVKYNPSGQFQWAKRFEGEAGGFDGVCGLELDASGNVYVGGTSDSIGALYDYLLIKYDPSGELKWTRRYNGPGNDGDMAMATSMDQEDNIYLTGWSVGDGTQTDFATVKFSPSGQRNWVARWDDPAGSSEEANDLAVDGEGNVYVTGFSPGAGTGNDITTVKYNKSGEQQWFVTYNGESNEGDIAEQIALDDHGDIYITGTVNDGKQLALVKYNPEGIQQWDETHQSGDYLHKTDALIVGSAGHILLGWTTYNQEEGFWNIMKLSQEGYVPTNSHENLQTGNSESWLESYPNPFTSSTTIMYTVPVPGHVNLTVFNAFGIPVRTLLNEYRNPGKYQIGLSSGNMSTGLYIIRMNVAGRTAGTTKILLLQ